MQSSLGQLTTNSRYETNELTKPLLPDPFPAMLPFGLPSHQPQIMLPSRPALPGVEAKLENNDLWQQFHKIGTEMIITKSGR